MLLLISGISFSQISPDIDFGNGHIGTIFSLKEYKKYTSDSLILFAYDILHDSIPDIVDVDQEFEGGSWLVDGGLKISIGDDGNLKSISAGKVTGSGN